MLRHAQSAPEAERPTLSRCLRAAGSFPHGVVVVTACAGDTPLGYTSQSFMALSLGPPMIAFTAPSGSATWPCIEEVGRCTVNVLSADQRDVALRFTRTGPHKFAGVRWHVVEGQWVWIASALSWINCEIDAVHRTGSHRTVFARIVGLRAVAGDPLTMLQGHLVALAGEPIAPAWSSI